MEININDLHRELGTLVDVNHGKVNKTYRKSDKGTYFSARTNLHLCSILDNRISTRPGNRVIILYGDWKKRTLWGDADRCYIGRTCGEIKRPIVLYTSRSHGGSELLDDCIVGLYTSTQPYNRLWTHPCWDYNDLRKQFLKLKDAGELYIRG